MKLFKKTKIKYDKNQISEIKIFNIPIIQYSKKEKNGSKEKYLKIFPSKSLRSKLFFEIFEFLKRSNTDFDDIYISRMNIGETTLLTGLINQWCKQNNSKKPIVILTQKYHKDIFDLYCNNIRYIYYPIHKSLMDNLLTQTNYRYKHKRIYYFIPIFTGKIIGKTGTHFSEYIKNFLNIDNYNYLKPKIAKKGLPQSFLDTKINKNKFIVLFPDATSIKTLNQYFWIKLVRELNLKGYDVFCNTKHQQNIIQGTYSANLSLTELYTTANYASCIIGIRSGIFDFLSSIEHLCIIALYSSIDYWEIPADNAIKSYTLTKLPFNHTDKIYELDYLKFSEDDLIKIIINNLITEEVTSND